LGETFLDFYEFLATIYYTWSDLKVPPSEGWPFEILPDRVIKSKSSRAVEVMCYLPYFKQSKDSIRVHYKSKLFDYTDAEEHLIFCPNRETQEADRVDERNSLITQEEALAQEEEWGTHLDWQFVRQVYRQHGWLDFFRKDEAVKAIEEFMALKSDQRGEWEETFHQVHSGTVKGLGLG
ncbi:hypothetical protein DM02DRAFT_523345, partial [Periconia macrospinosa]